MPSPTGKRQRDPTSRGSLQIDYAYPGPVVQAFLEYWRPHEKIYKLLKGPWGVGEICGVRYKYLACGGDAGAWS